MLLLVNREGCDGVPGVPLLYGISTEVCKGPSAAVMHVWVVRFGRNLARTGALGRCVRH